MTSIVPDYEMPALLEKAERENVRMDANPVLREHYAFFVNQVTDEFELANVFLTRLVAELRNPSGDINAAALLLATFQTHYRAANDAASAALEVAASEGVA